MVTLDKIKQIRWYRQSGAGIPFLIGMPFWGIATKMERCSGFIFPDDLAIFKTENGVPIWYHYFNLEKARNELKKIFQAVRKDDSYFRDLDRKFQVASDELVKLGDQVIGQSFGDKYLAQNSEIFLDAVLNFWAFSLYFDLLDPFADEIAEFIFGHDHLLKPEDINILISPQEFSCLQQEVADMLNIVTAYQADKDTQIIDQLLKQHSQKYHWLKNDYLNIEYLDENYFLNKVRKISNNPKELAGLRLSLQKSIENRQEQQGLIKKLNLTNEQIRKLKFFNWMINLRDERKRINLISHYYLLILLQKISDHFRYDHKLMEQLLPWELINFMQKPERFRIELAKRQKTGLVIFSQSQNLEFLSGERSKEYFDILENNFIGSEFSGSPASRGKIIGPVKIIFSPADFGKMNEGDILVTPMTRPEFIPVMKKAGGIVTDEGGITCHAAIISRELGIPCIIGTQIASRVLHDGDLVDLNANHGIIKIIMKTNKQEELSL